MDLKWLAGRERRFWGMGLGGLVVGLAALLFWFWLPSLVLSRVQARASAVGLAITAENVEVGLNGVALEKLSVRDIAGGDLSLTSQRMAVGIAWWRGGALREGVSRVRIDGMSVDVSAEGIKALLARWPRGRRAGEGASKRPASRAPKVDVHDAAIALRDASGAIVQLKGVDIEGGERSVRGRAARVVIGTPPGEVIELSAPAAELLLNESGWALKNAKAGGARFEWAADSAEGNAEGPIGRGRTVARLRALREVFEGPRTDVPPSQAAEDARPRALRLLAPGASLDVQDALVLARDGQSGPKELLRGLSAQLAVDGDAIRVRGKGLGTDGGSLSWDLTVHPGEARVEGNVALDELSLALFGPVLPPLPFFALEKTHVSATLSLSGEGLEKVRARGEWSIEDLTFSSEGLARTAVGPMELSGDGEATWVPARRELTISRASVRVGGVSTQVAGVAAWPVGGYRVQLSAALAKTACADALHAVPVGLLDELSTIEMAGDIAGRVDVAVDSSNLDATKVDFDFDDGCRFMAVPTILDLSRFQQPFTHRVLEPDGTIFEMETGPGSPAWTPSELVSPFFLQAVIAHEDGRFLTHHGFAEPEIAVALARNLKAKAFRFGASTITMQLVKNVFLHRDKLLSRKIQEALITWWLEQQWDKRRLLELYVNVIEYGPSVYGIRNAAWHYFGTIPMNLTPAQSAFLATILPGPKLFHEHYEKGSLSPSMKNRIAVFLKHMRARDRIDEEALLFGLEELEHFSFYRPDQPPPTPPVMRGKAQQLPFGETALPPSQTWDVLEPEAAMPEEDGSYGSELQ